MKRAMRRGNGLNLIMLIGMFACFIACEKDNTVPLDEIVEACVEPHVEFDLYSTFDMVTPLTMTLTSNEDATVSYTWYKVDEEKGDTVLTEGTIASWGGQISLKYTFTEEQFANDFPLHSLATQKYYCRAVVSQSGRDEKLVLCDSVEVHATLPQDIMSLWVETIKGEEPTCEFVNSPAGANISFSITNATKIPGRVKIKENSKTLYDSGIFRDGESGMTIKIRGNTSAAKDKKPFKIKLQKKADLLNRGEEYADKDWVLLGTGTDLKTFFGLKMSSYANFSWVPTMKFCNLVVNNEYRGLYILTEQVERDKDCRINVEKDGYLIEYDAYWWNEPLSFENAVYDRKMRWTFKYPSPEDLSNEQLQYITDYVRKCEEQVSQQGSYENYIDVVSFANWLLVHDILGFTDGVGSNLFFSKNDTGNSLLKMETPWDFDSVFETFASYSYIHYHTYFWFPDLLSSSNPAFRIAYKKAWKELNCKIKLNLWQDINKEVNIASINKSRALDAIRWGVDNQDINTELQERTEWIEKQLDYLTTAIEGI